jgi:hypothetical protein
VSQSPRPAGRLPGWAAALLIVLALAAVTALRSASLRGYTFWTMDEQFIVPIAAGFLGFDLNPRWFNYHPLPMYLLGTLYLAMYGVARAAGWVADKPGFVSLLFGHDAVFYVPAKLLASFAYTAGCAVLGGIVWRRTRSWAGALLVFAAPLFLADGIASATSTRNDSFVFLFLALTVYFACFAEKRPASVYLAVVCCAAAFASKIPAAVLVPVLFFQLAWDARKGTISWRHVAGGAALFPVAVFLFMPYAFLDFAAYLPTLQTTAARATTDLVKLGKPAYASPGVRFGNLFGALYQAAGAVPLAGTVLYAAYALRFERTLMVPLLFPLAYLTAFTTSSLFDTYWLRPVYPFLLLFPVLLVLEAAARPEVAGWWARRAGRPLPGAAGPVLAGALALAYAVTLAPNLTAFAAAVKRPAEDTRITAARWMGTHLPPGSRVVLEGFLAHYWPPVFSPDPAVTLGVLGYGHPFVLQNPLLMRGYAVYFRRARAVERPFRVVPMVDNDRLGYDMRRMRLRPGDYVVLTEGSYGRFNRATTRAQAPALVAGAQRFFAFIRAQEPVREFTGNGPTIQVYRMREGLNAGPSAGSPGGEKAP